MIARLSPAAVALLVAVVSAATVGGALVMQHGFGYVPCMLCLWGRWPHYVGAPLALGAALFAFRGALPPARLLLWLTALVFVAGVGISAYHAGVEWGFWPGPASCAGANAAPTSAGGLLDQMKTTRIVPCDAASFRVLGISLAGYNALISLALAWLAAMGARKA